MPVSVKYRVWAEAQLQIKKLMSKRKRSCCAKLTCSSSLTCKLVQCYLGCVTN